MAAENNGKVIWLQKIMERWPFHYFLQSYHLSIIFCSHITFPLFYAAISPFHYFLQSSPFHYFLQSYHLSIIFCNHITFPLFSAVISPFHYFLQSYHLSYAVLEITKYKSTNGWFLWRVSEHVTISKYDKVKPE
jgi:hypothetical protein